jgi:16S rRNA (cytosine967-C5)-methyltransferase
VVCADALDWQPERLVDGVLLDAPCSATGTLRRHPEGLWQKKEADVARLVLLQRDLLRVASQWLKPDGVLVYATCSLEYEEGEGQIADFCKEHPQMALSPITQREAVGLGIPKQWVTKQGVLRILPHYWQEYGCVDGFFAARLKKIA